MEKHDTSGSTGWDDGVSGRNNQQGRNTMNRHPLETIQNSDDGLFRLIGDTRDFALGEGEISKKNKLLVALAIDVAKNAEGGIASLAKQALDAGATKGEITEVLRVANYICGVGCIYTAARALDGIL